MATRIVGVMVATLLFGGATSTPVDQIPLFNEVEEATTENSSGTPAKIALFPGSQIFPDDLEAMGQRQPACPVDGPLETIELMTETCLSGEYYLRDNLKILEEPRCEDGSKPTMMFYRRRGCSGDAEFSLEEMPSKEECLWSSKALPAPPYYWSMIYRCDRGKEGAGAHQTAMPRITGQAPGPALGTLRLHHGTAFRCHSDFANRTHSQSWTIDSCKWPASPWPLESIEVVTPATCPNGTRAQLALYEDTGAHWSYYMCNYNRMTLKNGLLDVGDEMLNTCISMSSVQLARGGVGKALGMMFHCDGVEPEKGSQQDKPKAAMVSHSVCATSAGTYQWHNPNRPATFMYPEAGQCVNLKKAQQFRPYRNAVCPDGNPARLAKWHGSDCKGLPEINEGVDSSMFLNCDHWNLRGDSSYMFWCRGDGTEKDQQDASDKRALLTRDGCYIESLVGTGWTTTKSEVGATIRRVKADTCMRFSKDDQWRVWSGARCEDGKAARLAIWKKRVNDCRGKPTEIRDFDSSTLEKCVSPCGPDESCNVAFWCNGFGY